MVRYNASMKQLLQKMFAPERVLYGTARIAQRLSLFTLGLMTVLTWVMIVVVWITGVAGRETVGHQWRNASDFSATLTDATNKLSVAVGVLSLIALLMTGAFALFARVRRYEKRLLLDSIVFILFCLLSIVFSVILLTAFVGDLAAHHPSVAL